jgi:membrane protease subunit HflK
MKAISDAIVRGALAMAGGRSPWGGGNKGAGSGDAEPGNGAEPADDAGGSIVPDDAEDAADAPEPTKGPRNPWQPAGEAPRRSASIEDIFRARGPGKGKGSGGSGGGGGGFRMPERADGKSWLPIILGGAAALWLGITTYHQLGSTEQGIVTTFGKYSRTIGSGASFTAPWPIQEVTVVDVTSIKRDTIPEGDEEKLMLTSDQNLVDFSYLVRWYIKDLKLYTFQLQDPDATVKEVAEAAMRASVAEVPLNDVMGGTGRGQIEQNVRIRMQAVLDAYHSGVSVQGVEIKKADPPDKVNDAFQKVTAAQQDAQRDLSNAQAYAQQKIALAQGDAAKFDKVYSQYKLAPDVTRRRLYYETMERVLSSNDKVIVEANGVTPYLPLPEVRRRAVDATATTGGQ